MDRIHAFEVGLIPIALALGLTLGCSTAGPPIAEIRVPLAGLDPVELVHGREIAGREDLFVEHAGFRYLFASEATRTKFIARSERFEIQMGGQCARMQSDVPGNPNLFAVHSGRIYIFGSSDCRETFLSDPEAYVAVDTVETSVEGVDSLRFVAESASASQSWQPADGNAATGWPQWGGPQRNFKSSATGLSEAWPLDGPGRLWSRELGEGYSGIVGIGDALYTMFRRGEQEVVVCLDAANGETRWEFAYAAPFTEDYQMEFGAGPHATPLVVGDRVFSVGATGKAHALDRNTGRRAWSHDLIRDLGGTLRGRGYASSPVAYEGTVIMTVGGPGSALVAFDRRDGSIVWRSQDFRNSPSSPIIINVDGQDQLVAFLYDEVVGIDPTDGDLLWQFPHRTNWGLNTSTPVWGQDNLLFVSSAYDGGSRLIRLSRVGDRTIPEEVWFTRKMRVHFGNTIRVGDFIFGSNGDFGPTYFSAVDLRTGRLAWREREVAKASFLFADGRFIILDEDGYLTLATPTAEGLRIHARVELMRDVAWTVPTLVGRTLYVRDRRSIVALDLG